MKNITDEDRIEFLKDKFAHNAHYAVKAMFRIFSENQTEHEQNVESTTEFNGVGFTGADANILSSFSKQVERKRSYNPDIPWGETLSVKQMNIVFRRMPKYARQVYVYFVKPNEENFSKIDEKIRKAI